MSRKRGTLTLQRKIAIIDILIQNRVVTTDDLIQKLNLESMKNPYASLTQPISELRNEGIVPRKKEIVKLKIGHPTQYIRIIQSRDTIRTIFDNFPMCVAHLYNSDWVRETIINERIKISLSNRLKSDIKRFLRASPSFFKYFLINNTIEEIAHEWFWHVYAGFYDGYVEYMTVIKRYRNGKTSLPPKTFHEFFYLCAFIDMLNGDDTQEAREYIKNYKRITKG